MLDPQLVDRFNRLLNTRLAERETAFPKDIQGIKADLSCKGMFHSTVAVSLLKEAHENELDTRVTLAWNSMVRAYEMLGGIGDLKTLSRDMKHEVNNKIGTLCSDLSKSLRSHLPSIGTSDFDLSRAKEQMLKKHDIEIDLYVDSLMANQNNQSGIPAHYNFYGHVGTVQTGANASTHVIQNISDSDKSKLLEALNMARDAIQQTDFFGAQKQSELLDIAKQCETEMHSASPNSTRLVTMFSLLATSVQTIAAAKPAYQAMKLALLPLGITLP